MRFAEWLGHARRAADHRRAARARDGDRRPGPLRERRPLGVGVRARPRPRRGDRPRGDEPHPARADAATAHAGRAAAPRPPAARPRAVRARRRRRRGRAGVRDPRGRPPATALESLRLGTRGSALAIVQAELAVAALAARGIESTVVPVVTTGDRRRAAPDKEKWVKELELALLADEVDLAVHSAKDVPGALPEDLELVGALPRADAHDALCGAASLAALADGRPRRDEQPAAPRAAPRGTPGRRDRRGARQRRHAPAVARGRRRGRARARRRRAGPARAAARRSARC